MLSDSDKFNITKKGLTIGNREFTTDSLSPLDHSRLPSMDNLAIFISTLQLVNISLISLHHSCKQFTIGLRTSCEGGGGASAHLNRRLQTKINEHLRKLRLIQLEVLAIEISMNKMNIKVHTFQGNLHRMSLKHMFCSVMQLVQFHYANAVDLDKVHCFSLYVVRFLHIYSYPTSTIHWAYDLLFIAMITSQVDVEPSEAFITIVTSTCKILLLADVTLLSINIALACEHPLFKSQVFLFLCASKWRPTHRLTCCTLSPICEV